MSELEKTDWLQCPFFFDLHKSNWPEHSQIVDSVSSASENSDKFLHDFVLGHMFRKIYSFRKPKRIVALILKVRPAQHKDEDSPNPVLTVDFVPISARVIP